MEYRTLGRTGFQVGAVGMGTEYLLNTPRDHIVTVIHESIRQGVNYFDAFFAQPVFQECIGTALDGYRDQVLFGAHLGSIELDGQEGSTRDPIVAERLFRESLSRYRTDYVDVLVLHNIDPQDDYDRVMGPNGLLETAERLVDEGIARSIGFSGHTVNSSLQAVESGQVDVLMFPINMAGHAVPGRRELFQACIERNVGLVAMKPYAGGKLLEHDFTLSFNPWVRGSERDVSDSTVEIKRRLLITPVQCLAYVLAQPGVSTIVPGCKSIEELTAAQALWAASADEKDFSAILADFAEYVDGECVYCNHCLPCPVGIDVGQTIRLLETAPRRSSAEIRAAAAKLPAPPSECIQCGDCAERCPFDVAAVDKIGAAAELLETILRG